MRIGIFGGSFDPIHFGHLILAEHCRLQAQLDMVWFVPAARSPLKNRNPLASDKQRLEMLSLAIAGHTSFQVSTIEIDRGGISYTVDTLLELKEQDYGDEFFLLMGQDSLEQFSQWKDPESICHLATPLVVRRPSGLHADRNTDTDLNLFAAYMNEDKLSSTKQLAVDGRLIDISSSDIRARIGANTSIRYLLPRAVEKSIETHQLYSADS